MLNKLTFPEGGTETRYLWNKHQINYDGEYVWKQYQIDSITDYYWKKYAVMAKTTVAWEKYEVNVDGSKGDYIGVVSAEAGTYPSAGTQDGIYYERLRSIYYWKQYSRQNGIYLGLTNSSVFNQYPTAGEQNGYWYEAVTQTGYLWQTYKNEPLHCWDVYMAIPEFTYPAGAIKYYTIDDCYVNFNQPCALYDTCLGINYINYEVIPITDGDNVLTPTATMYYAEPNGTFSSKTINLYEEYKYVWRDAGITPTTFSDVYIDYPLTQLTNAFGIKVNGIFYFLNPGATLEIQMISDFEVANGHPGEVGTPAWMILTGCNRIDCENPASLEPLNWGPETRSEDQIIQDWEATMDSIGRNKKIFLHRGDVAFYHNNFAVSTNTTAKTIKGGYFSCAHGTGVSFGKLNETSISPFLTKTTNRGEYGGGIIPNTILVFQQPCAVSYTNTYNYAVHQPKVLTRLYGFSRYQYPEYDDMGMFYYKYIGTETLPATLYMYQVYYNPPAGGNRLKIGSVYKASGSNEDYVEWKTLKYYYGVDAKLDYEAKGQQINRYAEEGELVFSSTSKTTYPTFGSISNTSYSYKGYSSGAVERGTFIEEVVSTDKNAYPNDDILEGYWYIYNRNNIRYLAGEYIQEVRDEEDIYHNNGITGDYWYIYDRYDVNGPFKSKYTTGTVNSNVRSDYPDDAIQGNYWYDYQYDYEDYICHIYNDKIKGGVKYKQDINPEADYTVGCVASAEVTFDYDNSLDDFQKYIDYGYFDYFIQQPNDNDEWRLIGRFWLDDVKYKRKTASIKAYDAIVTKDIYIDEFIKQTTFPISLTNFFHSLCEFCGVVGVIKGNLANRNFAFADNFQAINIPARQIFQYIAEMAGGFIHVNAEGQVELTTYSATGTALDNTQYVSYDKSRYNTHEISGLTVRVNTDDLGVSTGDIETNRYIVENNPLFYCQSENEISGAVSALNNALKGKIYTPAKIELLQDFGINCGDIITVNGDTVYVMKKNITASGVTLECVGQEYRDKEPTSINSDIIALRGKTNELYRDLEQTRSTITDVEAGLRSEITQTAERLTSEFTAKDNETGEDLKSLISQTAEEIRMEVSRTNSETEETLRSEYQQTAENITLTVENQGKSISSLELRADSITSSVSNVQGEMSEIKQTANSIESRVQGVEGQVSSIRQDLDGIDLSYSSSNGTASITVGNITVKVPSEDGVEDLVEERVGIEMNGYVQFVDLEEEGATTINGDNITTGMIEAQYLGLGGWMEVHKQLTNAYSATGGYIGYATGDDGINATSPGIAMSNSSETSYFIATGNGVRMTHEDLAFMITETTGIKATEEIAIGSDARVKNDINYDIEKYEGFYKDLKPAYYKYNHGTSGRYHVGFVAQDVEEAVVNNGITTQDFAGLVQMKEKPDDGLYDDQYYLRYENFIALNTYMIQKLMKRIDELEAEVNTLKGE